MKFNSVRFIADQIEETDEFFRIPTVASVEGVQNGALKEFKTLEKSQTWLNGKPFVPASHPTDAHGMFVPVTSPNQASGFMSDTTAIKDFEINEEEKKNVLFTIVNLFKSDDRNGPIVDAIKEGKKLDVSVGFHAEDIPNPGEFNGVEYDIIETDIYFDHLALVSQGACSLEDGCGLGVNGKTIEDCDCFNCDEKNTCKDSKVSSNSNMTTMFANLKTDITNTIHSVMGSGTSSNGSTASDGTEINDLSKSRKRGHNNHNARKDHSANDNDTKEVEKLEESEIKELKENSDALAKEVNDLRSKNEELAHQLKENAEAEDTASRELEQIKADKEKAIAGEKARLIEEITKANGEDKEKYESFEVDALRELHKVTVTNAPVKKADMEGLFDEDGNYQSETPGLLAKDGELTVWAK
jgi:hypothetical protein